MIQYEEPVGIKSYNVCIDTKTITLYTAHLRKKPRERIEKGLDIYGLGFNDIKYYVKFTLKVLIKSGFKVILEKEDKKVLLIYNK